MTYSLRIKKSAAKTLSQISKPDRERIIRRIDQLSNNPGAGSVLKGEFSGLRRIRVGSYRVVYEIRETELIILVVRVGRRSGVYR